jgi:hypothetical protein
MQRALVTVFQRHAQLLINAIQMQMFVCVVLHSEHSDGHSNQWPNGLRNDCDVIYQIHLQLVGFDISSTFDRCRWMMHHTPTLRCHPSCGTEAASARAVDECGKWIDIQGEDDWLDPHR